MAFSTSNILSSFLYYIPFLVLASPTTIPLHIISAALDTDALHLALGCQAPLNPSLLNNGEFPACAAMITGYVFRVENEATVHFLQSIGTTGALTHLKVWYPNRGKSTSNMLQVAVGFLLKIGILAIVHQLIVSPYSQKLTPGLSQCLLAVGLTFEVSLIRGGEDPVLKSLLSSTVNVMVELLLYEGFGGGVPSSRAFQLSLLCLYVSRTLFAYVLGQQTKRGWHGAPEPGVKGSSLVLLSQDRWVRLDGDVDDLKAVTSGSWLQPMTGWQELFSHASCLLVWMSVLIGLAAEDGEKVIFVLTVLVRHVVAARAVRASRLMTDGLVMQGRKLEVDESRGEEGVKKYGRRLEMAEELIEEFGRRDWAEQMGMVKPVDGSTREVIM